MSDQGERFTVAVSDHAPASSPSAGANGASVTGPVNGGAPAVAMYDDSVPAGFGLAVISGLADDVHVSTTSSGMTVTMSWPSAAPAR
jgi:hypothetical protein